MSGVAAAGLDLAPYGVAIGHATDEAGATGCTVVRGLHGPLRAAVAIAGRATGTRELTLLEPTQLVARVDALLLTGGSAFGLDAAAGVVRWLEEQGRGFDVGTGVVPIVPGAVLFDLAPLGRAGARPTPAMGYAAARDAAPDGLAEGSVGAGAGALVGKALGPARAMKGGVGLAEAGDAAGGLAVAALAAVNAFGDVRDAAGVILAGARAPDGGYADTRAIARAGAGAWRFRSVVAEADDHSRDAGAPDGRNTTLAVVMLSAPFPRAALHRVAASAVAALHRRITPAGTAFDGDVVFAVAPLGPHGEPAGAVEPPAPEPLRLLQAEVLAVEALERAIERAVRTARGRDGIPGLADGD